MSSTNLNWLDRSIAYFSPLRGLRRMQARELLAYDAARVSRREEGWIAGGTSADSEITRDMARIRQRSRDLARNHPHAKKGLGVIVANKVGTGITSAPAPKRLDGRRANKRENERLAGLWARFVDECDATGRLDLYGLQSLGERTRSESGEAIIRRVPYVTDRDDVPWFKLMALEPDFIDTARNLSLPDGSYVKHGIQYSRDAPGRPVAYWMFEEHPGEASTAQTLRGGMTSMPVPATDVIHLFKPLRPGQTRGVSDFTAAVIRLRALDDYDDAEVMRKKVAACLAAFVTTPTGLPGSSLAPTTLDAAGRRVEQFSPGMIPYLRPGEAVTVADPRPSSDYEPFNRVQLRAIAAGIEVPYELLSGDLSEVNYTSHRGGLVQFRGMVEADQWQILVPQLCRRVWQWFLEWAYAIHGIDRELPAIYTPPRFGLLDPAKEVPAQIQAIRAGIMSYQTTVRREGYDPDEMLAEVAEFQRQVKALDVAVECVPPPPVQPGAAAPPKKEEPTDEAAAA